MPGRPSVAQPLGSAGEDVGPCRRVPGGASAFVQGAVRSFTR